MSRLCISENLNLLQHWCTVGSNKLDEQKFRCYCMDCGVSDNNASDDAQTGVRTGISHYYREPFYEVRTSLDSFTGVLYCVDW